ncbi:hypothetical protein INT47_013249 [Mucor saturninus]|uniref:C2 domain-containing protein n=1 Tax=Mucor saturninus TaxID=64648 RepID=A0A8H7V4G2_9FUNG|nr:hypothetical protein INT47_013249 [Mucor saturninus]
MSKPRIIGELVIVAYKARHLPERELVGKQDPFVVFRLGEVTKKTKTDLRGGQHPTWDDQVNLPVPEKKKVVIVQLFDEDAKRQELISECELDITKALEEGEDDDWYQLHYKGREAGQIYLELTFYAAQPPPKRQPTRYGGKHPKPTGYAPQQPLQQQRPYPTSPQYPPQPSYAGTPIAPTPSESHSTPMYRPTQPQYGAPNSFPYPPTAPPPSNSYDPNRVMWNKEQPRPTNEGIPIRYGTPDSISRPTSPPGPGSYGSNNSASLLSSSYNPRPNNYGGGGGYPQTNPNPNRNSFPSNYGASPYPQHSGGGGFPEPQQFAGGYNPHADPLGTPFAAHQGSFNTGPPQPQYGTPQHSGYPPNQNYPPRPQYQQGFPPNGGYNGAPYPPY